MATRDRKPKPTALKLLEGNPGKRGLNMNEQVPQRCADAAGGFCEAKILTKPTGIPICPDWLEDEAKAEWERTGKHDAQKYSNIAITDISEKKLLLYIFCRRHKRIK